MSWQQAVKFAKSAVPVLTAFGLLGGGALWFRASIIGPLDSSLRTTISHGDSLLAGEIANSTKVLVQAITFRDSLLAVRIGSLEQRVDGLEERMDERFDAIDRHLLSIEEFLREGGR